MFKEEEKQVNQGMSNHDMRIHHIRVNRRGNEGDENELKGITVSGRFWSPVTSPSRITYRSVNPPLRLPFFFFSFSPLLSDRLIISPAVCARTEIFYNFLCFFCVWPCDAP